MIRSEARSLPTGGAVEIRDDSGLDLLAEIADYLAPHYPRANRGSAVLCIHSPARLELPAAMVPFEPEGQLGAFTARIAEQDGQIWMYEPESEVMTRFDFPAARIDVHPSAANRYAIVQSCYAAVRAMVTREVQALGGRILHAGAVSSGGRGLIIVGDKGSGKTTLTTALLQLGADYLASDRVYLLRGALAGWPCAYRLAWPTLDLVLSPDVLARVQSFAAPLLGDPSYAFGGKARLPPAGFLRAAQFSAVPTARAWAIVELDPDGDPELMAGTVSLARYLVDHGALGGARAREPEPVGELPGGAWIARGRSSPFDVARALLERLRA